MVKGLVDSGSVQLSGLVPGPPPSVPAVIEQPTDQQRFSSITVTVEGTCEHDFIVELYRNGTLAGSVACAPTNTFSLIITLTSGSNQLVARTRDVINQYGPDSTAITVFYDVPDPVDPEPEVPSDEEAEEPSKSNNDSAIDAALLIRSKSYFRVSQETKKLSLRFTIVGGLSPYEVLIRWGDGTQTTQTYDASGGKRLQHIYKNPGQYRVVVEVIDANGTKAIFQTIAVVDGVTSVNLSAGGTLSQRCQLDAVCIFQNQIVDGVNRVWPLFATVSFLTVLFWFGERITAAHINNKRTR